MNIAYQKRKSKFIHPFRNSAENVLCPTFHVFSWGHRCSFQPSCNYCYLNLTFRYQKDPIVYTSQNVLNEVQSWMTTTDIPSILNAGELCDSFMMSRNQLLADIMNMFESQDKHTLLFLTKNDKIPQEIEDNIYAKTYKKTVFSFSINSAAAANLYERGAPNPFERIGCAYRIKKQGQRVRIRVDPIIEIKDFQLEYKDVVSVLNDFLHPERVTLGSLRFFKNLPNFSEDKDVFKYGFDQNDSDGRLRLSLNKRVEIYSWFLRNLHCSEAGLCKETRGCYESLFREIPNENLYLNWKNNNLKCNCTI